MTLKQAIKILDKHNKWRRGAEIEMLSPKEIGKAMDYAITFMKHFDKIEQSKEIKKILMLIDKSIGG